MLPRKKIIELLYTRYPLVVVVGGGGGIFCLFVCCWLCDVVVFGLFFWGGFGGLFFIYVLVFCILFVLLLFILVFPSFFLFSFFFIRLYGVRHMAKDHSDSERGNPLPPHGLLFSINSKDSFICIIPQTG